MHYSELVLNPTAKTMLDAYISSPSHGLLLEGPVGVGLATIAQALGRELVEHATDIEHIVPNDKGGITIDMVRSLYVATRDTRTSRQVVIVDDIDTMSLEAQNAFLKLLEEPTERVHFIVTTHAPHALLQTIRSRATTVTLRPVSSAASHTLIQASAGDDVGQHKQVLFIANGLPAEITRLLASPEYFTQRAAYVTDARDFLQGTVHERLVMIHRYTDRVHGQQFVKMLAQLVQFMITSTHTDRLIQVVPVLEAVAARLEANGHVRTQLMYLALHLK